MHTGSGKYHPAISSYRHGKAQVNFGHKPFAYPPPTKFEDNSVIQSVNNIRPMTEAPIDNSEPMSPTAGQTAGHSKIMPPDSELNLTRSVSIEGDSSSSVSKS